MCPAITAGPTSPGTVPSAYQPASPYLPGAASAPVLSRCRDSRALSTPIAGTRTLVGVPAGRGVPDGNGSVDGPAYVPPDGLATGAAAALCVTPQPASRAVARSATAPRPAGL